MGFVGVKTGNVVLDSGAHMEEKTGSKDWNLRSSSQDPASSDFSRSSIGTSVSVGGLSDGSRASFGGKVGAVAGSCVACFSLRRGSAWTVGDEFDEDFSSSIANEGPGKFSMAEVNRATGNFSAANIVGRGGFAAVYKGRLRDGSVIAVKRSKKELFDSHMGAEFKNEIRTLSQIEHLNLVRFLGYVEHADERILILEYVANGNLRDHLDGSRGDGLEMGQRIDIAIDIAHALTYLHAYSDPPIIHRDVKASNVLITEDLRAKVSDFGFAKMAAEDSDATHISTHVRGTAGYLDPEYLRTYQLTDKSDVYSFGVVLVELVSGRRPFEPKRHPRDRMTVNWAMQRFRDGNAVTVMDPRLRRCPASVMGAERMLGLAAQCLAPSRKSRPSMKRCAEMLWGIRNKFRELDLGNSSAAASPPGPSS